MDNIRTLNNRIFKNVPIMLLGLTRSKSKTNRKQCSTLANFQAERNNTYIRGLNEASGVTNMEQITCILEPILDQGLNFCS